MGQQNLITRKLLRLKIISFISISILFLFPFADSHSHIRIPNSFRKCRGLRCKSERSSDDNDNQTVNQQLATNSPKLLIILIDGFRWDYYTRQKSQLPGFTRFIAEGVHAEWVEPIFPSMSFPTWHTIATGRYPEEHNILGNYMLHRPSNMAMNTTSENDNELSNVPETVFSLKDNSTKLPFWWQSVEPIWTTVTKSSRTYLANWARCDVPYHGILPTECTGYVYQDVNTGFRDDVQTALTRLQKGFSLAMVYDDFIDHAGHQFGPDSNELKLALIQRDTEIHEMLFNMQLRGLKNKVNVVITSDHGMTNLNQSVKRVYLQEYLDMEDVYRIIDYGPVVGIAATNNRSEALAAKLATIPPGVLVYSKQNIPEEFHYKRGNFVLDFLLVATPGNFIVGVKGEKQIPNDGKSSNPQPYQGVHGYHNMDEMRTVFFAKGPAFKKGKTIPSISVVDQYQVFMKVLGLSPNQHNGNWDAVKEMLT